MIASIAPAVLFPISIPIAIYDDPGTALLSWLPIFPAAFCIEKSTCRSVTCGGAADVPRDLRKQCPTVLVISGRFWKFADFSLTHRGPARG